MIRRLFKWSWYFLVFTLCLMVLAILLTYALVGTERGFKLTSGQLNDRVPGLMIEPVEGNLFDGIKTASLSYESEQLVLRATGIQSQWSSELFGRKLRIKTAIIDEIDVELFAPTEATPSTPRENITLPVINLPVSVNAEIVLIKQLRIKPPGENAPIQIFENIRLSASAQNNVITINHLHVGYQNITTTASGEIELSAGYPLSIDITTNAKNIAEGFDLIASTKLDNSLERLTIQSDIQSPVKATLRGVVQPLDKKLPAKLKLQIDQAGWPVDTGEIASLSALNLDVVGDIDDYQFSLSAEASGQNIPSTQISLKGFANPKQVLVPDINISTLDGSVQGKAGLQLADVITWVANLDIADINPGIQLPDLQGKLNGKFVASGKLVNQQWSVDLAQGDINGELRDVPFEFDSKLSKSLDDVIVVDTFSLNNGYNQLVANGRVDQQWDLTLKAELPQLQNFLPGLAGGFKADAKVTGALKTPDISVNAGANVVKLNDLLVRGLDINADIKAAGNDKSNVSVKISNISQGANQFSNFALKLIGTKLAHTLSTFVDGPSKTSLDLLASGSLSESFDWTGKLDKTKIELPGHNLKLAKPVALAWKQKNAEFSVEPHCWISQDASLCLKDKVLSKKTGNANIVVSNYELEQLNLFLPAASNFKGIFAADTVLSWGSDKPGGFSAVLDATIEDGVIKVTDTNGRRAEFKYNSLALNADVTSENIDATLTVDSSTMGNADIAFNMNPASADQLISGSVNLDGLSINLLKAFLPDFQTIEGVINAEGKISGSLSDPKFDGNVFLKDLQVVSEILPLAINSGDITTRIKGSRAFIFGELTSGEGIIDIEGSANWTQIAQWRADINIDGKDLAIIQNPITESTVNPQIAIAVRPGKLDISGKVDVPRARINIKDLPKGATTLSSDIVVIEDEIENAKQAQDVDQSNLVTRISVDVVLGDDVELAGYGLKASIAGDMNLQINAPNPVQLGGELRIVNGVYKSFGQDLTIEDGQILFVGPIDQTSLDMDAVREIEGEDRKAGLHLDGKLSDPTITLFTDPADKSEESILSYIVLGRDIAEASDQESSLLASAALALTLNGGRNVGKSIADTLGISEFTLDARGKGDDTEVIVSGRVNDRLLLRYGRNIFEPESTLYLRYDITKKLYLEAARGIERAVDLFYSFSF